MRIVHVNLEKNWRGGERQVLYLMEGLRDIGHECTLVARSGKPLAERARKCGFPVRGVTVPFLLRGAALKGHDIVHVHETRGLQVASLWKPVHQTPIVFTRRVDNPPSANPLTRFFYASVSRMAVISRAIAGVMGNWGFDPSLIRVIPSAVRISPQRDARAVADLRARFRGKKVIGCVATLEPRKDHRTLLKAVGIVQEARKDVLFILLGDGALRKGLEAQARAGGLGNVVFEGFKDDPYPYYEVFDLFVITSRQEGLGSSILDAFAYGVPVVATAAGGIPDIVRNGETGLLAGVGDAHGVASAILRMLEDDALRMHCVRRAMELVSEKFSIGSMARSYDALYREIVCDT